MGHAAVDPVTAAVDDDRSARRRYALGTAIGGLLALAVFAWVVAAGNPDLFVRQPFSDFYDAQARSLMQGRWDVPRSVFAFEGFLRGGKMYTYFGIWPSVARMPLLALSDSLDGRLTKPSMLLAFAVLLVGIGVLSWQVRTVLRPGRRCGTGEAVLAGLVVFALGCGSTALYLGSWARVYHEAILWAVAWSLLAYERLVAFTRRPSTARLALAAGYTLLALFSRLSVGIGASVALGLILLGQVIRAVRARLSARPGGAPGAARALLARLDWLGVRDGGRGWLAAGSVALAVPLALYAWMNYSRFGTLFSVPWTSQWLTDVDAQHRAALAANGGTYFGLKFVPTTVVQYLRPDALSFGPLFPFLSFPGFRTPVFGGAVFDTLDFSSSVTASMPALVLVGVIGTLAVASTRFGRTRDAVVLRVPLLGASAGIVLVLAISYVAQRYLGDWLPLLVIASLTGLHALLRRREDARMRRSASVTLGVAAALAVFGVWANFSLAVVYQRLYNPVPESLRAGMIGFQYDLEGLYSDRPSNLVYAPVRPGRQARAGTTWIVGSCDALYWSDGRRWHAVEGREAGGFFRLRADFGGVGSDWEPIVALGPPGRQDVVGVIRSEDRFRLGFGQPGPDGTLQWTPSIVTFGASPGRSSEVRVLADPVTEQVRVQVDGRYVLDLSGRLAVQPRSGRFAIGAAATPGVPARFGGELRSLPARVGLCEELLGRRNRARALYEEGSVAGRSS